MFNAIFTNFFGNTSYEESTQNTSNNELTVSEADKFKATETTLDWILVDPIDNSIETEPTTDAKIVEAEKKEEDNEETLLGSFFDRNLNETPMVDVDQKKEDTWLITPLPCLTSITCSQRSIIENDPLENLLIEHPSMSVFIKTTNQNSLSFSFQVAPIDEEVEHTLVRAEDIYDEVIMQREMRKEKKQQIVKSKRKETPENIISVALVDADKKKDKKGKKLSNNKLSHNKENVQVKNFLLNEFKKSNFAVAQSNYAPLSRNQMKRSNKNNSFSSVRNVNANQRKYHKLHQPATTNFNAQY